MPRSVDTRSASGRRFRHLMASYSADLGHDLTEADQALLRQAVSFQLHAERLQADIVNGKPVDGDMLVRIASEGRRALAALRAKAAKTKPSGANALQEYLAARQAQPDADAPEVAEDS